MGPDVLGDLRDDDVTVRLVIQDPFNEHFDESPIFIAHGRLGLLRALMRTVANGHEDYFWAEITLCPDEFDEVQNQLSRSIRAIESPGWPFAGIAPCTYEHLSPEEKIKKVIELRAAQQKNLRDFIIMEVVDKISQSVNRQFADHYPEHVIDADDLLPRDQLRSLDEFRQWTDVHSYGNFAWWWMSTQPQDGAERVEIREVESIH